MVSKSYNTYTSTCIASQGCDISYRASPFVEHTCMLRDDIGLFVSADHRSKEMQCVGVNSVPSFLASTFLMCSQCFDWLPICLSLEPFQALRKPNRRCHFGTHCQQRRLQSMENTHLLDYLLDLLGLTSLSLRLAVQRAVFQHNIHEGWSCVSHWWTFASSGHVGTPSLGTADIDQGRFHHCDAMGFVSSIKQVHLLVSISFIKHPTLHRIGRNTNFESSRLAVLVQHVSYALLGERQAVPASHVHPFWQPRSRNLLDQQFLWHELQHDSIAGHTFQTMH